MKPVILLLDDEVDLLQVLTDALAATLPSYDVLGASCFEDAEAALNRLRQPGSPRLSLVVVDHMLGGRTGLEFLERLRSEFENTPAILFTGQATAEVEDRAQRYGARVLWKPIRLREWLSEVRELLGLSAGAPNVQQMA